MSDKTVETKASLAVRKPEPKPSLARTKKAKPVGNGADNAVAAPSQVAQAPGQSLAQVAVTAARAEGEVAKQAYLQEKQAVTNEFFVFLRQEQSATSTQIEDAVLDFHGLTRADLYEVPQPQA